MFNTIIATLILATASVALTSKVNAGRPTSIRPTRSRTTWTAPRKFGTAAPSNLKARGAARYGRLPDCSRPSRFYYPSIQIHRASAERREVI